MGMSACPSIGAQGAQEHRLGMWMHTGKKAAGVTNTLLQSCCSPSGPSSRTE
jgi:hypothetical protein